MCSCFQKLGPIEALVITGNLYCVSALHHTQGGKGHADCVACLTTLFHVQSLSKVWPHRGLCNHYKPVLRLCASPYAVRQGSCRLCSLLNNTLTCAFSLCMIVM